MDIRETLGQMVRGSIVNIQGRMVSFETDGTFSVWGLHGGGAPVHITKSLKEVVEYFESLPSPPPKALKEMIIPEAVTDEKIWEERVQAPFSEVMAAPLTPEGFVIEAPKYPATQLYGRVQRDVKESLAYEIPTLGTLVEPCAPYGYINPDGLATMCETIHRYNVNAGWWTDINTGREIRT